MPEAVKFGPGIQEQFVQYLCTDMNRALGDRTSLERKWAKWLDQYRAPTTTAVKNFPWIGAPLARDTEILTKGGWRRIDQIHIGEIVLTRRDLDGAMEWHPVEALPQRYADKLYHFKSHSIDLMVTGEHAMVCEPQDHRGKTVRRRADDLWKSTGYYVPTHGTWHGKAPDLLFGLHAGDVCEFVGWYLAEGWSYTGGSGKPSALGIGQSKTANPEKCRRLEDLFNRLRFRWSVLTTNSGYTVHKSSVPVALFDILVAQRGAKNKRVPAFLFELSPDLIDRLLTGLVLGDGTISERPEPDRQHEPPRVTYFTISKGLADDVQVLALLSGMHARCRSRVRVAAGGVVEDGRQIVGQHRSYEVVLCRAPRAKYDRSYREIVDYNDVAFCVTVKNHAIYARRNGIACWTGNSNRTLPWTAMNADPLVAKFMTTLHAPDSLWTLQPLNERWVDVSKPMQDYLQYLDETQLHMYDVNYRAVLEFVKLGTCLYKTGWTFERRPATKYDFQGKLVRTQEMLSHPFVDHVSLVDFLIPAQSYEIQADRQGGAPWVAERFFMTLAQFMSRAKGSQPFLPDYDPEAVTLVKQFVESGGSTGNDVRDMRYKLDDYEPSYLRRLELWEGHCRYDTTGEGNVDDVVAVIHLPSRTLLRAVINPYRHGLRPYSVARFFRGDGFYGIGMCEQSEVFQELESTLLNYQIDNVLAVNSPMLGVKLGSNVVPGEPVYPLKIWPLDNPSTDIREIKLSEMYQSLPQLGGMVQVWGERRTGQNDLNTSGNPSSLPSRTPATSLLSMLAEGNKRPDLSLKEIRAALGEVGLFTLQNCQQFLSEPLSNPEAAMQLQMIIMALGEPEGSYVAQKLAIPLETIESGLGVSITATSSNSNKEVEKQSFMALLQLQAELFMPMYMQLASILGNPQLQLMAPIVVETAGQLLKGTSELQQRLYEQFDIRNSEDLVVNAAVLLDHAAQSAPLTAALHLAAGNASANAAQHAARAESGDGRGSAKPHPDAGVAMLLGGATSAVQSGGGGSNGV